ncbi:ribonuclease H, partial [Trifolium pratense]
MKILSWNCQGMGNPKTVRALNKLIANNFPDLVFIMETKLLSSKSMFLSRFKDTYKVHQIDCSTTGGGRAGGLLMMWNHCNIDVNIINENFNYIDVQIDHNNIQWRATGIYGYPQNQNKLLTCNLIDELAGSAQNPRWLLFGDFNIILNTDEKLGGHTTDTNVITMFRNTINRCNLQDLGYLGEVFTWTNRQEDHHHIKARLDRFLASEDWTNTFSNFKNTHLVRYSSDHNPILLDFSSNPVCRQRQHQHKRKKYEMMWTRHEDHFTIVKEAWQSARGTLNSKLESTLHYMHHWGQQEFGSIPKKIKAVQAELHDLNNKSDNTSMMQHIQSKELELDKLLESEEMWWNQRSRILWLQHGDKNTKFFHQKASQRRKRNHINTIQDSQGNTQSDIGLIETTLIQHFSDLFTSQETHNTATAVEVVKNIITSDMKDHLSTNYTEEEVIGKEVTKAVLDVLNHEGDPSQYNSTHICLIPKIKNPMNPGDYRPISLCNVILKIITKTIANRLKTILPNIISHNQSAFIQDRLITDNTLVAFEIFHYFKYTKKKKGFVGIKTDMAKAYDRVEWSFLQATLEAMGFPKKLTDTIIRCVSTVQFSILINGIPSMPFKPQRGLRQGDPLSPYLFILCADVLSGLITQAQQKTLIHGVKSAPSAPEITHLLFADDSLFFCRANKEEINNIKNIILDYQKASGQLVNMTKSELIFSKKVPENVQLEITQILPMKRVEHFSKYLGMPTDIGRSKHQVFNHILDRVWKKLKGWKEKHLSFAGRSTLIKAVVQAIPTYIMSCFLLPKGLCKQLESMACNFWWGSNTDKKKIHWINWKKICKNKFQGGLGFRNTCMFNEALLAKQGWRIATQPDSLVARVFKAKYFPKCHFMEAKSGNSISYTWRSILQARWILKKGCYWTIGNGKQVKIWKDNWLPHQNGFKVWSKQQGNLNLTK